MGTYSGKIGAGTRLLAIDMDGTCVSGRGRVSERTLGALRKAAAAGIEIVPTTGRTVTCLPGKLREEPYIRYAITSNGASVLDLKTGKTVFKAAIPFETGAALLGEFDRWGFGVSAHVDDEYLVQGKLLSRMGHIVYGKDANHVITVRKLKDYVTPKRADFEELQVFFVSAKGKRRVEEILAGYAEAVQWAFGKVYVEVFSQAATKGTGLAALGEHLGIPAREIACIGDGENDLSMFRAAGVKLAMGNGVEALKQQADHVLLSNREDGAAEGIERLILGEDGVLDD